MRLINADKVPDEMENKFDMQELYLPIHFKELVIDEMPTVEAIPKEKVDQAIQKMNYHHRCYRKWFLQYLEVL